VFLAVTEELHMELTWTAWNNSKHLKSGAGYGLKVPIVDRDKYFKRSWSKIILELPLSHGDTAEVEVNISKSSFWNKECHELIRKDIGIWLRDLGLTPWPSRNPPKLKIQIVGENRFRIKSIIGNI
jgi:hypothetical protein